MSPFLNIAYLFYIFPLCGKKVVNLTLSVVVVISYFAFDPSDISDSSVMKASLSDSQVDMSICLCSRSEARRELFNDVKRHCEMSVSQCLLH